MGNGQGGNSRDLAVAGWCGRDRGGQGHGTRVLQGLAGGIEEIEIRRV